MEEQSLVDSELDLAAATAASGAPAEVLETLRLLEVSYLGFDGRLHRGQLVVSRDLASEVGEIFAELKELAFPIRQVVPVVRFGWSDESSMAADNTSAFNYRLVAGTGRLSLHALGRAVDVNPRENPVFYPDGQSAPPGARYSPGEAGTFAAGGAAVAAFLRRGWRWGGLFEHVKDYHHFEKG